MLCDCDRFRRSSAVGRIRDLRAVGHLAAFAACCLGAVLNQPVCRAALANEDPSWRSDLTQTMGPSGITQNNFANLVQQYLISNNQANVLAQVTPLRR